MTQPPYPCLWFDGQAQTAAHFYCSVFENSRIRSESPMVTTFELNGQPFMALNGGPHFTFNEAVSWVVNCDTQEEIDYYWEKLTANGGKESQCGWLKDAFGVSWQIVPSILSRLMADPERATRVTQVLLQMKKLDIQQLEQA